MSPRVSIGMPVYNGVRYVEAAMRSVLDQTYDDLELVVSDNASTDGTSEVCRRVAAEDDRVRYVRQDHNRGYVENFNEVFRLAGGEYFAWAAADDLRAPTFVERCVEVLEQQPEVALVMPRTIAIDEQGTRAKAEILPGPGHASTTYEAFSNVASQPSLADPDPVTRYARIMRDLWYTVQLYGLVRRRILARTGLHPAHSLGDHILLSELVLHGPFAEIAEPLFLRRLHDGRVTDMDSIRERVALVRGRTGRAGVLEVAGSYVERLALHSRGVRRAPLTAGQRIACHRIIAGSVGRWALHRARRALG